MIANDEGIKTREDLERRLLAFGIEPAGVSDYEMIYARAQAIFQNYVGEITATKSNNGYAVGTSAATC
jgi:hypothetical protein